ncbi:SCP2 sterol-binding domain-containing protein [Microbulbifer aggregans]|uniref:SCP2 sterol-binding domain-containing protein n=1 Tax=Microbulbifer aggregans TaxID=1769779 RepID=UPI001CFCB588|nr:SCP2 sterol-binding domain-containing protein [Microbulbifer aggregans]
MRLPAHIFERLQGLTCLPPITRVQFRLPDGSDFYLQVTRENGTDSGRVVAMQSMGFVANPELELEMSFNTLKDVIDGSLSARHAFLLGDIRFSGDRNLAAALADLFTTS